jgi:ketosteroid isomerase-like protein
MNQQESVRVVEKMFAAFGQKNLPGVLDTLAEHVDWQSPVTRSKPQEVSWAEPRRSREEVATFFKDMLEKVQPEALEPLEFTTQDDRVAVEGKNRGIARSTGRPYEHDWVMLFTVRDGKIVRFRHYYDTSDVIVAFHSK